MSERAAECVVCVKRYGYAAVPICDTDDDTIEQVKSMQSDEFDWSDIDTDDIQIVSEQKKS